MVLIHAVIGIAVAAPPPNCADTTFGTPQTITINTADTNFVLDLARCTYSDGLTITASSTTPLVDVTIDLHNGLFSSLTLSATLTLGRGSTVAIRNTTTLAAGLISLQAKLVDGAVMRLDNVTQIGGGGLTIAGSYQSGAVVHLSRVTVVTGSATYPLTFSPASPFTRSWVRIEDSTFRTTANAYGVYWNSPLSTHVTVEVINTVVEAKGGWFDTFLSESFGLNATLVMRGNTFRAFDGTYFSLRLFFGVGRLDFDGTNRVRSGLVLVNAMASSTGSIFALNGSSVTSFVWSRVSSSTTGTNETILLDNTTITGNADFALTAITNVVVLRKIVIGGTLKFDAPSLGVRDSRIDLIDITAPTVETTGAFTRTPLLLQNDTIGTVTIAGVFTDVPLSLVRLAATTINLQAELKGGCAVLADIRAESVSISSKMDGAQVFFKNATVVTGATVFPLTFSPATPFTRSWVRIEDSTFRTTANAAMVPYGVYWNSPLSTHVTVEVINTVVEGKGGWFDSALSASFGLNATLVMRGNTFRAFDSTYFSLRLFFGVGRLDFDGTNRVRSGLVLVNAMASSTGSIFALNGSSVTSFVWSRVSSSTTGTNETVLIDNTTITGNADFTLTAITNTIVLRKVAVGGTLKFDAPSLGVRDSRIDLFDITAPTVETTGAFTRTPLLLQNDTIGTVTIAGVFTDVPLSLVRLAATTINLQAELKGGCAVLADIRAEVVSINSKMDGVQVFFKNATVVTGATVFPLTFSPASPFTRSWVRIEDSTFRTTANAAMVPYGVYWNSPQATHVTVEVFNTVVEGKGGWFDTALSASFGLNATLVMRGNTFRAFDSTYFGLRLFFGAGRLDFDGTNRVRSGLVLVNAMASSTGSIFALNGSSVTSLVWSRVSSSYTGTNETIHILNTSVSGDATFSPRLLSGTVVIDRVHVGGTGGFNLDVSAGASTATVDMLMVALSTPSVPALSTGVSITGALASGRLALRYWSSQSALSVAISSCLSCVIDVWNATIATTGTANPIVFSNFPANMRVQLRLLDLTSNSAPSIVFAASPAAATSSLSILQCTAKVTGSGVASVVHIAPSAIGAAAFVEFWGNTLTNGGGPGGLTFSLLNSATNIVLVQNKAPSFTITGPVATTPGLRRAACNVDNGGAPVSITAAGFATDPCAATSIMQRCGGASPSIPADTAPLDTLPSCAALTDVRPLLSLLSGLAVDAYLTLWGSPLAAACTGIPTSATTAPTETTTASTTATTEVATTTSILATSTTTPVVTTTDAVTTTPTDTTITAAAATTTPVATTTDAATTTPTDTTTAAAATTTATETASTFGSTATTTTPDTTATATTTPVGTPTEATTTTVTDTDTTTSTTVNAAAPADTTTHPTSTAPASAPTTTTATTPDTSHTTAAASTPPATSPSSPSSPTTTAATTAIPTTTSNTTSIPGSGGGGGEPALGVCALWPTGPRALSLLDADVAAGTTFGVALSSWPLPLKGNTSTTAMTDIFEWIAPTDEPFGMAMLLRTPGAVVCTAHPSSTSIGCVVTGGHGFYLSQTQTATLVIPAARLAAPFDTRCAGGPLPILTLTIVKTNAAASAAAMDAVVAVGASASALLLLCEATSVEVQAMIVLLRSLCGTPLDHDSTRIIRYFISPFIPLGPVATVLGNAGLAAAFAALHLAATAIVAKVVLKQQPLHAAFGPMRFPSIPFAVATFLYMGVIAGTVELLHHRDSSDSSSSSSSKPSVTRADATTSNQDSSLAVVAIFVGITYGLAVPVLALLTVLRAAPRWWWPRPRLRYEPHPSYMTKAAPLRWVYPQGFWAVEECRRALQGVSGGLDGRSRPWTAFPHAVCLCACILLLAIPHPAVDCLVKLMLLMLVFVVAAVAVALWRPYRSPLTSILTSLCFAWLALLCVALAVLAKAPTPAAERLKVAAIVLLIVTALLRSLHQLAIWWRCPAQPTDTNSDNDDKNSSSKERDPTASPNEVDLCVSTNGRFLSDADLVGAVELTTHEMEAVKELLGASSAAAGREGPAASDDSASDVVFFPSSSSQPTTNNHNRTKKTLSALSKAKSRDTDDDLTGQDSAHVRIPVLPQPPHKSSPGGSSFSSHSSSSSLSSWCEDASSPCDAQTDRHSSNPRGQDPRSFTEEGDDGDMLLL